MPELGEIKMGREIGKQRRNKYVRHACVDCGKERWVDVQKGKPAYTRCPTCANRLPRNFPRGENHFAWKGGRRKTGDGYIRVLVRTDDFFYPMASGDGYVMEHRLIVAKALNRCLLPWEIVHHKTGYAKGDNRYPETLELITDKRFHMVDVKVKAYIKRLERKITLLEIENQALGGNKI